MNRPYLLLLLVGLLLGASSAQAETEADVSSYPWSSIAKLNNRAGGSCTAVVIAPDEVLTAAHCILNRRTGRFSPPSSLHVLLGYRSGEYAVHAPVEGYTMGPGYDPDKTLATLSADWVVLRLEDPLPPEIRPLELCEGTPALQARLMMASFARGRRHVLTVDDNCKPLRESRSRLLFENDCKGAQGSSGAPILISNGDSACVAGVQVAMEKGVPAPRMIAVSVKAIAKAAAETGDSR